MKSLVKIAGVLLLGVFISFNLYALSRYIVNAHVKFVVSGTSTLHDWDMVTESARGYADIVTDGDKIVNVNSLKIYVPVKTLKSGKSGMDNNAYDALEADDHEKIRFIAKDVKNIRYLGDETKMTAYGDLTIAGTTKPMSFNVTGQVKNGKIYFQGDTGFKMTDFNVEPPTAMFGTIETGDEITVKFNVAFKPE